MTSNSVDDADSLASNSGRINLSGFCIGDHYKPSDVARNTLPGSGNDTGRIPSVAVRSTQPQPYSPEMCGPENDQPNGESRLLLYIGASTNPLPLDYGFIAAPTTAKLQHGHVNPLPKESLHHG